MNQGFAGQVQTPHIVVFVQFPDNPISNYVTISALSTNTAVGVMLFFEPTLAASSAGRFINLLPGQTITVYVRNLSSLYFKGVNSGDILSFIGS